MCAVAPAGPGPGLPPLDEREVSDALTARGPTVWTRVIVVASTASTNADLAEVARAGEPEGTVLIADHQSAGRGRLGRVWQTPPRSALAVSVLLRPQPAAAAWPWLALLTGLAVTDAVDRVCGLAARLKWPNDVLLPGPGSVGPGSVGPDRKVCGVLADAVSGADGPTGIVLGAGINVSQDADGLPVPQATSLRLAGARTLDRTEILIGYLHALSEYYRRWTDSGGDVAESGLAVEYRRRCATIGSRVRVHLPGRKVDGVAEQVDAQGRLVVRDETGTRHEFAAGDVVHLRPGEG
jgi:BirA family transcriptional regulator, biotin operon repressor / biotin---[acetyl-CoA-carboxylase] ligase